MSKQFSVVVLSSLPAIAFDEGVSEDALKAEYVGVLDIETGDVCIMGGNNDHDSDEAIAAHMADKVEDFPPRFLWAMLGQPVLPDDVVKQSTVREVA